MVSLYYLLLAVISFAMIFLSLTSATPPANFPKSWVTPTALGAGIVAGLLWPLFIPASFLYAIRKLNKGKRS